MQVANKKIMWKMEMPAILEEGSLDKPSGMSDLLTVRSLFAPVCRHVMALEPVNCLRENKRTQLTALRCVLI